MPAKPRDPEVLRVALIADTHGFLDPRIMDAIAHCDRVVHAGDIGDDDILDALDRPTGPVIAVAGNNDTTRHWPADRQTRRHDLPQEVILPLPGGDLAIIHGHRQPARNRHARLRRRFLDAQAVVCGHSHRAHIDTATTPWILNPGAAGRSRACGGPGCLVLTASRDQWQIEEHRFEKLPRTQKRR